MHVRLSYLVLWVLTTAPLISAQLNDFEAGGSENKCNCTPSCSTVGVSECNGRILPRSDCPCCNVCLRQKGESCEEFNSPCEKGLTCSSVGICEDERSCKRDVECPGDEFCIGNACTDPCPLLQPCLQSNLKGGVCITRKHVAQCDCPKHHKADRDLNICVSLQGCSNNGKNLTNGEYFYKENCSRVCFCGEDSLIRCQPMYCPNGLFPTGSASSKDLCIEIHVPEKTDDCCVIQACMKDSDDRNQIFDKPLKKRMSLHESTSSLIRRKESSVTKSRRKRAALRRVLRNLQDELANSPTHAHNTNQPNIGDDHASVIKTEESNIPKTVPQFIIKILPRNPKLNSFYENGVNVSSSGSNETRSGRDIRTLSGEITNKNIGGITMLSEPSENKRSGKSNEDNAFETNEENPALANIAKSKKKTLQLMKTDHNSSMIILPTTYGGVLHYKESKSGSDFSRLTAKNGQTELMIQNLIPSTRYTLKWAGNDGSEDKVEIKTEDGCLQKKTSFRIGYKWNEGCAEKCECLAGGEITCQQRCIFVKGAIQDDQCREITSSSDPECCVEYACKNTNTPKTTEIPKLSKSISGSIESQLIVTSRTEDSLTVAWEDFREINPDEGYIAEYRRVLPEDTEEWMQQEVPQGPLPPTMTIKELQPNTLYEVRVGLYKNTQEKLQVAKTETITVRTKKFDPCTKKTCALNAHCEVLPMSGEIANCTCDLGFYLDPKNNSCALDKNYTSNNDGCSFQGKEYSPGDVFYDGCLFKCTCDEHREIDCKPRCQFNADSKHNEDCSLFNDPEDNCCKLMVCNTTLKSPYNSLQPTSLDSDGCLYSNKTYKNNESFNIGCELKCLCMGYGDVSCFPRCPPVKTMSMVDGATCTTLDDPLDNCCTVTVCDNSTSEVLKDKELTAEEEVLMAGAEKPEKKNATNIDILLHNINTTDVSSANQTVSPSTEYLELASSSKASNVTSSPEAIVLPMNDSTSTKEMFTSVPIQSPDSTSKEENPSTDAVTDGTLTVAIHNATITFDKNVTEMFTEEQPPTANLPASSTDHINMPFMSKNESKVESNNATLPTLSSTNVMTPANNKSTESTARSSPSLILSTVNNTSVLPNLAATTNISNVNNKSIRERKLKLDGTIENAPHLNIIDVHKRDAESVEVKVKVSRDIMAQLLSFTKDPIIASYSHDSTTWKNQSIMIGGIGVLSVNTISFPMFIQNGSLPNMLRIYYKEISSPIKIYKTRDTSNTAIKPKTDFLKSANTCQYKGKPYKIGEEFYDGCDLYCTCTEEAEALCAKIECPDHFGLDIMDPGCLEWKDDKDYVPVPPRCCRRKPRCVLRIEDFACTIDGHTFDHLDVLPLKFVKCDQRCQCMKGHIDCENLCSPIQATPPFDLPCHPSEATVVKNDGYPCCPEWQCSNASHVSVYPPLPHGIVRPGSSVRPQRPTQRIFLPIILDVDSNSVQFTFKIPSQFVGLPGGIYLRYTASSSAQSNPLDWQSEVIHEDGITLSGADWVYQKANLHPDSNYSMQVALSSRLAKTEIVSPIFSVRTPGIATSPLPKLELNAAIKIGEVKNISAKVTWRQFTDFELQYIDGIGVRYWPDGKKFPLEGPMLHRKSDNYMLKDLKPNTGYTVDLIFLTHDGYSTNIFNTHNMTFKTLPKPKDKYVFDIAIKMGNVTKKGVQILYSGVTEPEGKYVNVFRAVYTTDGDLRDSHKFKVPKNQKEGFILLTDLKPSTAYEVWLEAYLTNGITKKSNVITIHTNPAELRIPDSITDGGYEGDDEAHYYTALVWVSVIAALAFIAFVLLILYIWKRQNHAKAQISSKGSYDNPSYKGTGVGYGIEMNGMKSNGNSRDES